MILELLDAAKGQRISPSQFKLWELCPRKWWYKYQDGANYGTSAAANLGKGVHSYIEDHYRGQLRIPGTTNPKVESISKGLIPRLPGRGPGVLPEREVFLYVPKHDVTLHGIIDILDLSGTNPKVVDIKTSSNPERWGLTQEQLLHDPQAIIYAAAALTLKPDAHWATVQFVYANTKTCQPGPAPEVTFQRGEVFEALARLLDTAREMREAEDDAPAGKPSGCSAFGGCPMKSICPDAQKPGSLEDLYTEEENVNMYPKTQGQKSAHATLREALARALDEDNMAMVAAIAMLLAQNPEAPQ